MFISRNLINFNLTFEGVFLPLVLMPGLILSNLFPLEKNNRKSKFSGIFCIVKHSQVSQGLATPENFFFWLWK